MVELVNIYNLEAIFRAINANAFATSADINKLRALRTLVYKTDLVPMELVNEFELAEYEFGIHTKPTSAESNPTLLRSEYLQ